MTIPVFEVPSRFWPDFLARFWNKGPGVLRRPFPNPPATMNEIFTGMRTLTRRLEKNDFRIPSRFFLEGKLVTGPAANIFHARETDVDLAGYIRRLEKDVPGEYGFAITNFQALEPYIWARFTGLLADLYKHLGFPLGRVLVDVFIGNYTRSFLGLHKDSQDVITFVVSGRKKFLVWPYETFADVPGVQRNSQNRQVNISTHEYTSKIAKATVLEGEPGDVLYWPRDYWHIAESDGGTAVTIALGFLPPQNPFQGIFNATEAMLDDQLLHIPETIPYQGSSSILLDQLLNLQDTLLKNADLQHTTRKFYLSWITRFGFDIAPDPLDEASLDDSDLIQACPHIPIIFLKEGENLLCSVNGQNFFCAPHPNIIAMFEEINKGIALPVGKITECYKGEAKAGTATLKIDADGIKAMLLTLLRLRAIWKVSA